MAAIEDGKRVGVALFLILLAGVALIAVRPVFAATITLAVSPSSPTSGQPVTSDGVILPITVIGVPENYSICVIRAGVEQSDGTVLWLPGYEYPGTPISQCQNMTEVLGQDVLGRTIVINQFILNGTYYYKIVTGQPIQPPD